MCLLKLVVSIRLAAFHHREKGLSVIYPKKLLVILCFAIRSSLFQMRLYLKCGFNCL